MGREHIENINALGDAEVTALVDTDDASRAQALALCVRPPSVFETTTELIASGQCDALIIATPNHTHAEVLRPALESELHILVEKPVCTNIADGLDLVKRAAGRKALVWVAQEYRYMPPVAEMIRMAHAGRVGRVHQVSVREHREPFYPKVGDWNRFNANTGGTLVEKCCHYFNLMELVLGERATRVFASGGQRVNHLDEHYGGRTPDILDSAYAVLEYPSGARAMLDLCMFAEGSVDKEHITVIGSEGKLESLLPSLTLRYGRRADWGTRKAWGEPNTNEAGVSVRRVWDTTIRHTGVHFGASFVEHRRFVDAIRKGTPAEIGLEEGLRAVAVGLAAHRSIELGRVVEMSEVFE